MGRFAVALLLAVAGGGWAWHAYGWQLRSGATRSALTRPRVGPSPSPSSIRLAHERYIPGHCYTWNQSLLLARASDVSCSSEHLIEVTGTTRITGYAPGAAVPAENQWAAFDVRFCSTLDERYLGYPLDPQGLFAHGAIHPTPTSWSQGDRTEICGLTEYPLQQTNQALPGRFAPFSGRVEGRSQARVFPIGSCLVDSDLFLTAPCTAPHVAEVAGAVTVTGPARHPLAPWQLRSAVAQRCLAIVEGYVGRPFASTATERLGWTPLSAASWAAGTRTVNCLIDSTTSSGHWATVTGSIRAGSSSFA